MTKGTESQHEIDAAAVEKGLEERPRSATLLNLKWIADRFRRSAQLKEKVKNGQYDLDSERIAKAMMNQE